MICEAGTCWAGPLGEVCDHWKGETERLRLQVLALENDGLELAARLGEAESENERLREALRGIVEAGDQTDEWEAMDRARDALAVTGCPHCARFDRRTCECGWLDGEVGVGS